VRESERQRETERETESKRERERLTERKRQTDRERERQRERATCIHSLCTALAASAMEISSASETERMMGSGAS
jgi:hypothetical protein